MAWSPAGRHRRRWRGHRGVGAGMNELMVQRLRASGLDPADVRRVIDTALDEDLGPARLDVTSVATIPADQHGTADVVARAGGVVAGLLVAAAVFEVASEGTLVV